MIHLKYIAKSEVKWIVGLDENHLLLLFFPPKVFKERCDGSRRKSGGTDGAAERRAGTQRMLFFPSCIQNLATRDGSICACCSSQEKTKSAVNLTKSVEATRAHLQGQLRNKEAENERLTVQLRVRPQTLNVPEGGE